MKATVTDSGNITLEPESGADRFVLRRLEEAERIVVKSSTHRGDARGHFQLQQVTIGPAKAIVPAKESDATQAIADAIDEVAR